MKLLDFTSVIDFINYLQGQPTQCKIVYDFYIKWLGQQGRGLDDLTIEQFIKDLELVSSFFDVLNNSMETALENNIKGEDN